MNDWGANMNNEEINLDFLDNIKLDENLDNDIVIEEPKEAYNFDIDKEEEEELDFDLNELINKIDSKIEELNKEDSNNDASNDNNDVPKEIKIESDDITPEETSENIDVKVDGTIVDEDSNDVNELISKIDAKLEELNKEETSENEIAKEDSTIDETVENPDGSSNSFNVNELISKIDAKLEELNNESNNDNSDEPDGGNVSIFEQPIVDEEQMENDSEKEISSVIDEKNESTDVQVEYASDDKKDSITDNINVLFEKVNSNVREASDIFTKNVEMKKKLDRRFEELKDLQRDIEKTKQSDYEEINKYKDAVLEELTSKKAEVEARLNELKDMQAKFEKEKTEFERYKKSEKEKLEDLARDNKVKDTSRKEELELLEDKLRKQKDSLDEEKRQLSLDRIQYEADKNELANNMLKFNEIVGTFTDGVGNLN